MEEENLSKEKFSNECNPEKCEEQTKHDQSIDENQQDESSDEKLWQWLTEQIEKSDYEVKLVSYSRHRKGIVLHIYVPDPELYFPSERGKAIVYWNYSLPFILVLSPYMFPELANLLESDCGESVIKSIKQFIDIQKRLTVAVKIGALMKIDKRAKKLITELSRLSREIKKAERKKRLILREMKRLESL